MKGFSDSHVNLRQMIIAMEDTVSIVGMDDRNHGKRVGYIASQLGKQLGLSEQTIQYLFELGLLHDCGVSTEQMHSYLVNHFNGSEAHIHCEAGYRLFKDFEPLAKFAIPILYHHTPWEELEKLDVDKQAARMANLIFLADRIDVMAATHYDTDLSPIREKVINYIAKYSGTYFEPGLVSAFQQIAKFEVFWTALEEHHVTRYTSDMGKLEGSSLLTISQLKQFAIILANIVAQRSPFTDLHAIRVASLAKYLASAFGLLSEQGDAIEIACLLHDLGKRYMPDNLIEKPGTLSDSECAVIKQYSYETYEILRPIKGLGEIARWAAFHHEGFNGIGYPFYPEEKESSIEARIIAVADVFQELVQDRVFGDGMSLSEAIDILDELTSKGKLEANIVNLVKMHQDKCFEIATGNKVAQCV